MKTILALLLCLLTKGMIAQSANLLFEIDGHYIFADTSGNIAFGKCFSSINEILPGTGEYIVSTTDYKYGVVRNNQVVFPFEYDQIAGLKPTYNFHLYALGCQKKHALATADGVIHTGFDYKWINEYNLDYSSKNKGINNDGVFFQLKNGEDIQLMYVSKANKSTFLTNGPVGKIEDSHGVFVFQKGKQQGMFEFDPTTVSMKTIHRYAEQDFDLRSPFYTVWDPKKELMKRYSYTHKLLETSKGLDLYEEIVYNGVENVEGYDPPVEESVQLIDLEHARSLLKRGYTDNVFKAFTRSDMAPSLVDVLLKYHAQFETSGEKGSWQVKAHFWQRMQKRSQKDTSFQVIADELLIPEFGTGIILTKTGKLYGAVDSRGNVIFAPQFKTLERLRGENGDDWLLEKTGKESTLYYYDPVKQKVNAIVKGEKKDEFEIHSDYLLVKRPTGKNKYDTKFVKWIPPLLGNDPVVFDRNDFYDSIIESETFSYFFNVSRDGKRGVLSSMGQPVISCKYDSIQLNAYFCPLISRYNNLPDYQILQPIFSAYLNGKQHIFHPTNIESSSRLIHSFEDGSLNPSAKISDDGLYVIDGIGNNQVNIYSINGNKLSGEPVLLHSENKKLATLTNGYWYLRAEDAQKKEVLIGQNGAWFELPDK